MYMHPGIVSAIAGLLYQRIPPASTPIAWKDPSMFDPPADCPSDEYEVPATIVCSAATLVCSFHFSISIHRRSVLQMFYTLHTVTVSEDDILPSISSERYVKEFRYHQATLQNLGTMGKMRHKKLHKLYTAVQK